MSVSEVTEVEGFETVRTAVGAAELARVLGNASLATVKPGDLRPTLELVELRYVRAGGVETLRATATDSYWLLRETVELSRGASSPDAEWTVYVPAADLAPIAKASKAPTGRNADVVLEFDPVAPHAHLTVTLGAVRVATGSTDVGWPNMDAIIDGWRPGGVGEIGWTASLLAKVCKVVPNGERGHVSRFRVLAGESSAKPARVEWAGVRESDDLFAIVMPCRL